MSTLIVRTVSVRPFRTRATARVAAVLIVGLGLALVAGTPAHAAPRIDVTPDSDLDPAGQVVTVRGEGYDTTKGIYVAWCVVPPPGQVPSPCGGGADQDGTSGSSVWVSSNPPPYGVGLARPYGLGGTFEVDVEVTRWINDEVDCLVTACAVTTRNDHTRTNDRSQDVFHPVSFRAEPTAEPTSRSTPAPEPTAEQTTAPQPTQPASQPASTQQPPASTPPAPTQPASTRAEPSGQAAPTSRSTTPAATPTAGSTTAPLGDATPEPLVPSADGTTIPDDTAGTGATTTVDPSSADALALAEGTDAGPAAGDDGAALASTAGAEAPNRGPLIFLAALLTSSTGVAAIRQKRQEP